MDTEYLVVYNNTECKEVEHVCKVVPDIGISIFPGAFRVEAIGLGDSARFMITADEVDALGVS